MASEIGFWEAVPWVVAVAGWGFTHIFSEARERRKEVRSQLDKCIEHLLALEKAAREFHMKAEYDPIKGYDLTTALNTFERRLYRISCLSTDSLTSRLIALRRSITLSNFDLSDFKTQDSSSEILGMIAEAAASMEDAVEAQYRARYPNNFPYFRWHKKGKGKPEDRIS